MRNNQLYSFLTITAVILGISVNGVLAAAQPIPGVDISAKKNPGGFPKKPSSISPTNKKCPPGYVLVSGDVDACELLKDIAASGIPDADSSAGGDSASSSRLLPTVNKKTMNVSPRPSGNSTKETLPGAGTGKSDSGGQTMQDSMMTR